MRFPIHPGPYLTVMPDGEVISYCGVGYVSSPTVTLVDETGRILQRTPAFMNGVGPWIYKTVRRGEFDRVQHLASLGVREIYPEKPS